MSRPRIFLVGTLVSSLCFVPTIPLSSADSVEGSLDIDPISAKLDLTESITLAVADDIEGAAINAVGETAEYLFGNIGEDAPDWAKRFEFEWQTRQDNRPEWSILTVQPIWEADDLRDTVFTQLSYRRYEMFSLDRDVVNAGLGYRRLFLDDTVLVGVNGFFDYEVDYHHQRSSLGAEVKWYGLDLDANKYWGLSSAHTRGVSGESVTEEPLDGHDIRLAAQVPYLPWAKVRAARYWWDTINASEDIKGWSLSGEIDLMQNLQLEAGVKSDNFIPGDEREAFVAVRFSLAFGKPVAMSVSPI